MDDFLTWFYGLATVSGMGYFLLGFVSSYIIFWAWCMHKHKRLSVNWRYAGMAVGIVMIVFVSLQTQIAYNLAKVTAQEVQDCQREFNDALKSRARIASENDELSQEQRRIVFDWMHNLIFPPEPFAAMETNDPRRQDYGFKLTIRTTEQFQKSLDRQDELQTSRDAHPLPDPTCGK